MRKERCGLDLLITSSSRGHPIVARGNGKRSLAATHGVSTRQRSSGTPSLLFSEAPRKRRHRRCGARRCDPRRATGFHGEFLPSVKSSSRTRRGSRGGPIRSTLRKPSLHGALTLASRQFWRSASTVAAPLRRRHATARTFSHAREIRASTLTQQNLGSLPGLHRPVPPGPALERLITVARATSTRSSTYCLLYYRLYRRNPLACELVRNTTRPVRAGHPLRQTPTREEERRTPQTPRRRCSFTPPPTPKAMSKWDTAFCWPGIYSTSSRRRALTTRKPSLGFLA